MKERLARGALVAMPTLFALAFVLTVYADTGAVLYALPRALLGAAVIALVLQVVAVLATRSLSIGSFVATGLLVAAVDVRFGLVILGLGIGSVYSSRIGRPIDATGGLSLVVVVLFLVSAGRAVTSEAFVISDLFEASSGDGPATGFDPDVYVILLDGYPRSDTLAGWGYDNIWFERELAERGFDIASESTSSYTYTGLTLASMFNMAQLPDIPGLYPAPETHVGQTRALVEAINHNPVLEEFNQRGYWTVSAGLTEVRGSLRAVDEYLDGGEMRLWERQVMQRTSLWPLLCEWVVIPQHRSLINSTFDQIEETASSEHEGPVFMFAHVMSPHTPIVFDASGQPTAIGFKGGCGAQFQIDATTIGLTRSEYGEAMGAQVEYLNTRTLRAIDQIIRQQPGAVVVVFSDHGARYSGETTDEWFRSFFAARTPERNQAFSDVARPLDIFPTLLASYFGEETVPPDERKFQSPNGTHLPLLIMPWDGQVNGPAGSATGGN